MNTSPSGVICYACATVWAKVNEAKVDIYI